MKPNRFACAVFAAAWLAGPALAQSQPAAPADKAATRVAPVTVDAPPPPKVLQKQARAFVQGYAVPANPEMGHIARWDTEVCVEVLGLPDAQAALVQARLDEVARSLGLHAQRPGCHANIEVVFISRPQALMDAVAKSAMHETLLGYYHRHEHNRLKKMSRPIQAWYVTSTSGAAEPGGNGSYIDDPETNGPAGCGDSRFRDCLQTGFANVLVVADTKALEGKDLGLVADYIVMLAMSQPKSLDGCADFPSVIDVMAKSACPGRPTPDGLTPSDAAYLTALYKADLEARKTFAQSDLSTRMAEILIKANAKNGEPPKPALK
jgi:hypothetical protein